MSTALLISPPNMTFLPLPRPLIPMTRPPTIPHLPTPPSSTFSSSPPMSYGPMQTIPPPAPAPPAPPRFRFERLPSELQRDIASRLDYQSLIALSRASRHLHRTVDPRRLASPADKFALVMRAENYFPQHFPVVVQGQERPGNFACYLCFRVRGPAHFDADQPRNAYVDDRGERVPAPAPPRRPAHGKGGPGARALPQPPPPHGARLVALRRFCIECGVGHGLHRPGDSMVTKLRQELWVCGCRMVWQKPTCLRCTRCGGDCPLRAKAKS